MNVAIVNISIGNVGSVEEAFRFLGAEVCLADTPAELAGADLVVLAGVGNFMTASAKLWQSGFRQALQREVGVGMPILGICLGMQLFADEGLEGERTPGFGWIPGQVVRLSGTDCKVPHIGWNDVRHNNVTSLFPQGPCSFYFLHGYHFLSVDPSHVLATTTYGGQQLVAAVRRENVIGVQFHPEKSQGEGLRFLKAVLEEFA